MARQDGIAGAAQYAIKHHVVSPHPNTSFFELVLYLDPVRIRIEPTRDAYANFVGGSEAI
jgi:hypothetical protein